MQRKRKVRGKICSIYLPLYEQAQLEALQEERGVSRCEMIRLLIRLGYAAKPASWKNTIREK